MINSVASATRTISSIYAANGQELASVMAKIAAGKRYVQPSDDFVAFLKTNRYESDVQSYENARTSLGTAKMYTDAAQKVGGILYENLTKMAQMETDYVTADTDTQTSLSAQYNALKTATANLITNTQISGTSIVASGSTLVSASTGGGGSNIDVTFTAANTAAAISGLDITAGGAAAEATTALDYLSQAQGWAKTLVAMASITDTIIASKQAAIEEVSGINDAEELARVTDLQVRQQASISMLAQASMSGQRIAYLFGGG